MAAACASLRELRGATDRPAKRARRSSGQAGTGTPGGQRTEAAGTGHGKARARGRAERGAGAR
eukprot:1527521-Lingulodinium_polyedra.AAC.1